MYSIQTEKRQINSLIQNTCRAEAFEIQDGSKQGVLFNASYDVSFAFPESTTKTTSLMVILVSAMLVAKTIFLTPPSGFSNINLCRIVSKMGTKKILLYNLWQ